MQFKIDFVLTMYSVEPTSTSSPYRFAFIAEIKFSSTYLSAFKKTIGFNFVKFH